MDLGLKGKKAVVSGATRGIGRRIVDTLAAEGCDIALCARQEDQVKDTVNALSARGIKAIGETVDVRDKEAYTGWVQRSGEALGGIDILVPNVSAGGGMERGEQHWYDNLEIDVLGTTRAVETAMPMLEASDCGAIIIISTTAAVETFIAPMPYNAMKAGLLTYCSQLSQMVAGKGIRVNAVSPGPIYFEGGAWDYIKNNMPDFYNGMLAKCPMGRMGTPEEVANVVCFLASPAASWVTGQNVLIDGAFTQRVDF